MIVRAIRTFLGYPVMVLGMMVHAVGIAAAGETDTSERILRSWARLCCWVVKTSLA